MSRKRQHRLDGNHHAIRARVESLGFLWLDCAQTGLGFDALIVAHGRLVPAEVKDGSLAPSRRKLTPHEGKVHQLLKAHGITVEMLTDEASLQVLERTNRRDYDRA